MSVINPREFAEKYLKNWDPKDLAQVGLDVRIARLYHLDNSAKAMVKEKIRAFASRTLLYPMNGEYDLIPGQVYEFESDIVVSMPVDAAGLIVHRSSMLRNGVIVTSGIWDPGFTGNLNGFILPQACTVTVGQFERVGQFVVWEASACSQYTGIYLGTKGTSDVQNNTEATQS